MSALEPAENGFLRPRRFERRSYKEIAASLYSLPEGRQSTTHPAKRVAPSGLVLCAMVNP